jgi:pimeloyl-ACP methyl ester carboxylesterase
MAVMDYNVHERLHEIDAPALVLTGTDDKIVPSENSKILANAIPAASLVEFECAGHGFIVEKAQETNTHVLDFLRPHKIPVN